MPAPSREEPHEEQEEDLLPLPITQENPSKDELLGLDEPPDGPPDRHADEHPDDGAHRDDADLDLDDADVGRVGEALRDLADVHEDIVTFDDVAAPDADPHRTLDLPEDDAHFEDRANRKERSTKDDEPRDDERALEAFGGELHAFDDGDARKDRADRGVEGLSGEDVELDEASLPAMDADTGGEFELTDLLSELGFGATREFVVEVVHEIGPVTALAVGASGFCAGTASSVFFEGSGGVEVRRWPRPVQQIERAEDGFVLVDTGVVSHAVVAQGIARPAMLRIDGSVDQVVVVGDQLVARIGTDVLLVQPSGERTTLFREAASIGSSSSTLMVATRRGALMTRRGHDGAITEHRLDGVAASAFASGAQILASGPKQCLVRSEGRVLWVRPSHPTEALSVAEGSRISAACSAGLGFDFLVVVEDATRTLLAAPHAPSSELHILADLSSTFTGGVSVIRWDEPRQEAVLAGTAGVARVRALAPH